MLEKMVGQTSGDSTASTKNTRNFRGNGFWGSKGATAEVRRLLQNLEQKARKHDGIVSVGSRTGREWRKIAAFSLQLISVKKITPLLRFPRRRQPNREWGTSECVSCTFFAKNV